MKFLLHNTGLFRAASLLPSVKRGWPSCFVRACFWHTLFSFSLFALILFHLRKRWTFICVWCESTLTTLRMCVYVAKLFNCCNNPARDKTLPKQRLSNWIMEAIFPASHRTKGLSLPQGVSASGDWKPHVPHLKGSLWVISVLQLVGHHHTLLFWFSDNSGGIYTSLPYCMCATKWINWKRTASVPWSRGTRYKTVSPLRSWAQSGVFIKLRDVYVQEGPQICHYRSCGLKLWFKGVFSWHTQGRHIPHCTYCMLFLFFREPDYSHNVLF